MTGAAREQFRTAYDHARSRLRGEEVLVTGFDGEDSDFVRFNGQRIRQAGTVRQRTLHLDLIEGRRHARGSISLGGDPDTDRARIDTLVADLRAQREVTPEDPYLLVAADQPSSEEERPADLAPSEAAVDAILSSAAGADLAGIYAAGDIVAGFASSTGVEHWFRTGTFNVDWSLYLHGDKATKNGYAGTTWDDAAFETEMAWSRQQLEALARPPLDLAPGDHRTYLAPAAMQELVDMLAWGGFGLKAHRTKQTPLLRMVTDGATFDAGIRIREDIAGGTAPRFQSSGFSRPEEVVLIDDGRYAGHLVSPRSAQEYGVDTNGAESHEAPVSVALDPGSIPADGVLDVLDTGLYVGNLWYLNFSDRTACRTTGMTRFATFWVEGGEIAAPVNVLRFDDTAFNILGDRLEGLTDRADLLLDPSSYGHRSTDSARLPGAVVTALRYTL